MTSAFGGAVVLTHRPVKATIEVYPGQDMEVFARVPAGGEQWPAGTSAELRFYDGPTKAATLLDTVPCDVDPAFIHVRVESTDLEALPARTVWAVYTALPTSPTTDYIVLTGSTTQKNRG